MRLLTRRRAFTLVELLVVGATNPRGEEPARRAMNINCPQATIYHRFGIDVNHVYHDRTGRSIPIPAGL